MADASCSGPSPFKRLVDHQTRDISHHQDRLVDQAAAQGRGSFRSAPQQPDQAQDGFGAFMGGNAALPGMPHDAAAAAGRLHVHAAALRPANPNIFSQQPQGFPALRAHAPPPVADVSNWAADFARLSNQQSRMPDQNHQPHAAPSMQQMNLGPSQLGFHSAFGHQPNTAFASHFGMANSGGYMNADPLAVQQPECANAEFDQEMSRWMASNSGSNMTDVDAAMDQMARELELNEAALAQAEAASQANVAQASRELDNSHFTDLETPEIGNLSLESSNIQTHVLEQTQPLPEESEANAAQKGKSAVSDAAERLLESVQHEDGDKWKNSVFLSLMRDFRDGRKDIVDNEIRPTNEEDQAVQPGT